MNETKMKGLGILLIGIITFIAGLVMGVLNRVDTATWLEIVGGIITPISTIPISIGIVLIYDSEKEDWVKQWLFFLFATWASRIMRNKHIKEIWKWKN